MNTPIKKYWFDNDAVRSTVFNASSIIVPLLERFVETTILEATKQLTDEKLEKDAEMLLHEEKAHYSVHEQYNEVLKSEGYKFAHIFRFERWFLRQFEGTSLKTRLALCLCGEYFTALMAKHTLENGILVSADEIDERLRRMWLWHSLEELHHRSIAFDLYQSLGGGYMRRAFIMTIASSLFLFTHTWCFLSLLRQDKKLGNMKILKDSFFFMFGVRGYYGSVFARWFAFFSPHFHPSKLPIEERLLEELHHYHVEDKLIADFVAGTQS